MGKSITFLIVLFFIFSSTHAQDDQGRKPVRSPFASTMLVDNQTIVTPFAKTGEFIIHHRFGLIEDITDLYGIYAPSNIRLGFNYGITEKIMVGIGSEKNNKLQDIQWKYRFLDQTRDGKIPLSMAYYGNMSIDARDENVFGEDYSFTNRFSYFHQLIFARKFSDRISAFVAPGISHFNAVDSVMDNTLFSISYGGRVKIYNETSFIFEGNHQITKPDINPPKPGVSLGVEFGTSTHAFQVFAGNFDRIVPQKNFVYNQNDISKGDWLIGFNITVRIF